MRNAAAQLDAFSRCGGSDPGRQPGACGAGSDILVAELSERLGDEEGGPAGARLEAVARVRAGAKLQRREIRALALVLEFWRRRDDGSVYSLDRHRALGDESGPTAAGFHARRQVRIRRVGLSGY